VRTERDERVSLEFRHRNVLRVVDRLRTTLHGDAPRRASRNPITEKPNLHFRHAFMQIQRRSFREFAALHLLEEDAEGPGSQ